VSRPSVVHNARSDVDESGAEADGAGAEADGAGAEADGAGAEADGAGAGIDGAFFTRLTGRASPRAGWRRRGGVAARELPPAGGRREEWGVKVRPEPVIRRRGRRERRGLILLFVVVLLTLLAVLGSAFLISSRLAAGQVPPSQRGSAETSDTTRTPPLSFDANLSKVETMVKGQLVLDLMARSGVRATPETDEVGTSLTLTSARRDFADAELLWRPTKSQQDAILVDDVFDPMAGFADGNLSTPGRALSAGGTIDFPYLAVDAGGGTDPHLASHPHRDDRGDGDPTNDVVLWPWVSAPLAGLPGYGVDAIFVDPFARLVSGNPSEPIDVVRFAGVGDTNRRANLTSGLYLGGSGLQYDAPSPPRGEDTPVGETEF